MNLLKDIHCLSLPHGHLSKNLGTYNDMNTHAHTNLDTHILINTYIYIYMQMSYWMQKHPWTRGRWAFLYFDVQVFQPWQECRELAAKLLRWLRPGGHLFFRESCFHASGAARVAGGNFFLWFFSGQMGRSSKPWCSTPPSPCVFIFGFWFVKNIRAILF